MIEYSSLFLQYGILGLWTLMLIRERSIDKKENKEERKVFVNTIKETSVNMALINDNLKDLKNSIQICQNKNRG